MIWIAASLESSNLLEIQAYFNLQRIRIIEYPEYRIGFFPPCDLGAVFDFDSDLAVRNVLNHAHVVRPSDVNPTIFQS